MDLDIFISDGGGCHTKGKNGWFDAFGRGADNGFIRVLRDLSGIFSLGCSLDGAASFFDHGGVLRSWHWLWSTGESAGNGCFADSGNIGGKPICPLHSVYNSVQFFSRTGKSHGGAGESGRRGHVAALISGAGCAMGDHSAFGSWPCILMGTDSLV